MQLVCFFLLFPLADVLTGILTVLDIARHLQCVYCYEYSLRDAIWCLQSNTRVTATTVLEAVHLFRAPMAIAIPEKPHVISLSSNA